MHAAFIADELSIKRIIIPAVPGNFSALGLLFADHSRNLVRTWLSPTKETPPSLILETFQGLEQEGRSELKAYGHDSSQEIQCNRWVGLRYVGQWYEIDVPFDDKWKKPEDIEEDFHRLHLERYGHCDEGELTEVVNYRLTVSVSLSKPDFLPPGRKSVVRPHGKRDVYFVDRFLPTAVYRRDRLGATTRIRGPAIVEEEGSTTVIPPGWRGIIDRIGNLVLERGRR